MKLTYREILAHLLTLSDAVLDEEFRIRTNEILLDDNKLIEEHLISDTSMHDNIYVSIINVNREQDANTCNLFDGVLHT